MRFVPASGRGWPYRWRYAWALGACIVASLLTGPTFAARDPASPRFPAEQITLAQWSQFRAEVRAMPEVRCGDVAADQLICEATARGILWVFTREGHPAHPAVSRRVMVVTKTSSGTAILIDRTGHYAGDALAFRTWMRGFAALDEREVAASKQTLDDQP